jgi:hypothetical protein
MTQQKFVTDVAIAPQFSKAAIRAVQLAASHCRYFS